MAPVRRRIDKEGADMTRDNGWGYGDIGWGAAGDPEWGLARDPGWGVTSG